VATAGEADASAIALAKAAIIMLVFNMVLVSWRVS
jgi:hypothetical protein